MKAVMRPTHGSEACGSYHLPRRENLFGFTPISVGRDVSRIPPLPWRCNIGNAVLERHFVSVARGPMSRALGSSLIDSEVGLVVSETTYLLPTKLFVDLYNYSEINANIQLTGKETKFISWVIWRHHVKFIHCISHPVLQPCSVGLVLWVSVIRILMGTAQRMDHVRRTEIRLPGEPPSRITGDCRSHNQTAAYI
jgi:hypothetical protein